VAFTDYHIDTLLPARQPVEMSKDDLNSPVIGNGQTMWQTNNHW